MSIGELKEQCAGLSYEDKLFLLFYLKHSLRAGTSSNRHNLKELHDEMEAGNRVTLGQLKAVHQALASEGM